VVTFQVLRKNMLFSGIDPSQRAVIVDAMMEKRFGNGDAIIRQGDQGDFYYILASGTCHVFKNGNKVLEVCAV
jgi:cAMP-dependent protein kinase regulator